MSIDGFEENYISFIVFISLGKRNKSLITLSAKLRFVFTNLLLSINRKKNSVSTFIVIILSN